MEQFRLKQIMNENPDAKLRDLVAQLLYDDIINLKINPGAKLNVNQIAASLGISRTPVAEAIGKLTEIGFVVQHPGQTGSFVLELNLNDMISLYRVRTAIESEAASICAHVVDDDTLRELAALADAFKDSVITGCATPTCHSISLSSSPAATRTSSSAMSSFCRS